MQMKTKTIIFALILGLFSFWGCDDNSTEPKGDSIIGSWEKLVENLGGMVTLSFLDNGTYTAVFTGENEASVSGTYTLSGDEITFMGDSDCPEIEGKYKYSIDNDRLTFSLIADDCEGRNEAIPGTWTKK